MQGFGLLHGMAHHLGVVLRDLVELLHCGADFTQPGALLGTGARNLRHACGHAADAARHLGDSISGRADQAGAGLHLAHRCIDQLPDFLGCVGRTLGQGAHLSGHHGKSTPLFARAGRFHCRIQRQDIGLESDGLNHARDVFDAF